LAMSETLTVFPLCDTVVPLPLPELTVAVPHPAATAATATASTINNSKCFLIRLSPLGKGLAFNARGGG
jgi:hypothetical protein